GGLERWLSRPDGDDGAGRSHRLSRLNERLLARSPLDVDIRVESRCGAEPDGLHAGVPHHPGVARCSATRVDVDRELPGPAARRYGCSEAGAALVEGG